MKTGKRILPLVVLLAIMAVASWLRLGPEGDAARPNGEVTGSALAAQEAKRSDVWVEDSGIVVALLADDLEGSRHQRFLVRLAGGSTILVSHNIDLAPRVPLEKGDEVDVRGEYVWNEKGGLVHWTHHDPKGRHAGGWIRHRGREYH